MTIPCALERIQALAPYSPGMSIAEIRAKYGIDRVIKLASNENPLGVSPLVQDAVARSAALAFRYPQGGNPRLVKVLAELHGVESGRLAVGNGSDEIIDLLIRIMAEPGSHNIVCFEPCFSIYPIQARISGIETRRQPLEKDFSFDFDALLSHVDSQTRLVFITTPDNPSGYCPVADEVAMLADKLAALAPEALLVIDEAYMDFAPEEKEHSLLAKGLLPDNVAFLRTFSKSWGMAGLRLGYGILPPGVASCFWRARLPFSVNILAEEAALAAISDDDFRGATLDAVKNGRRFLREGLEGLGCSVWPSAANFLLFHLPDGMDSRECFEKLLASGIIIRPLTSYGLPEHFRVSVGTERENRIFLETLALLLADC